MHTRVGFRIDTRTIDKRIFVGNFSIGSKIMSFKITSFRSESRALQVSHLSCDLCFAGSQQVVLRVEPKQGLAAPGDLNGVGQ